MSADKQNPKNHQPVAAHQVAALSFVANIGTLASTIDSRALEEIGERIESAKKLSSAAMEPIFETWQKAVAQGKEILRNDSVIQRLERSAALAVPSVGLAFSGMRILSSAMPEECFSAPPTPSGGAAISTDRGK